MRGKTTAGENRWHPELGTAARTRRGRRSTAEKPNDKPDLVRMLEGSRDEGGRTSRASELTQRTTHPKDWTPKR